MLAAVVSYIVYSGFDAYLFPDIAGRLILTRVLLGLSFLALIEIGVRRKATLATMHLVAAMAIVAGAVGWLFVAVGTSHQDALADFMVFGTVFVLGANLFFNFRFWLSAVSSITVTVGFVGVAVFDLEASVVARLLLAFYFLNCLCLSLYLSWRLSQERYQTFLHSLQAQIQEQVAIEKGQKLVEIANTDPLTGLPNRRAISDAFSDLCKAWSSDQNEIGVILIDVDYFKRFNDRLGHQAGDDCLIKLARAFAETAASLNAVAGRYGGEEFVVLCKVSGRDHLREVTQRFCQIVEELEIVHPDRDDGLRIVTISAGASLTRKERAAELRPLLQEADRALYSSKFAGRATFRIYDPRSSHEDHSTQNLAELLRVAVSRDLVSVVYQPIYDVASGRILGHETLMRLRDFDGSVINPSVFIPVAEQTGAISELGLWVIDRACTDMVQWGLGSVVTANVSAVQLKSPTFALQVVDIFNRHGLSPHKLALEITEGIDISMETQVIRNIEHLQRLGVQIWLDDFGTGFAGLAWLRRLTFDVVKIDRSFLHDCQTDRGLSMMSDMVRLLRNLDYTVLVEGVETEEQHQLVRKLGAHAMQGYFGGRPMPIEDLPQVAVLG